MTLSMLLYYLSFLCIATYKCVVKENANKTFHYTLLMCYMRVREICHKKLSFSLSFSGLTLFFNLFVS